MSADEVLPPLPPPSTTPLSLFIPAFLILIFLLAFLFLHFFHEALCDNLRRYLLRHRSRHPTSSSSLRVKSTGGLTPTILGSCPTLLYEKVGLGTMGTDCPICLSEMEEGEEVRVLTVCYHVFHARCIDRWLLERATCPVCRSDLKAPPCVVGALVTDVLLDTDHVISIGGETTEATEQMPLHAYGDERVT